MTPPPPTITTTNPSSSLNTAIHDEDVGGLAKKSWEELNKEAKTLENTLDTQLLSLSRLTSAALRSGRGSTFQSDAEELSEQIEEGLKQLAKLIDELGVNQGETGNNNNNNQPPTSHLLQRHRDIHMDYVKELRKAKTHLSACLQSPSMTNNRNVVSDSGANDYLLKEGDRINHASTIADHILRYFVCLSNMLLDDAFVVWPVLLRKT